MPPCTHPTPRPFSLSPSLWRGWAPGAESGQQSTPPAFREIQSSPRLISQFPGRKTGSCPLFCRGGETGNPEMGQGEGLPPMGKRDLLEDPSTSRPVLDISRAAGPPAPTISGSPRIPPATCGHTPGFPCKIKCTCSGGRIWSSLQDTSPQGPCYCLSPQKGVSPSVLGEGSKGSWETF